LRNQIIQSGDYALILLRLLEGILQWSDLKGVFRIILFFLANEVNKISVGYNENISYPIISTKPKS
jgi:hypothetical protein